MFLITEPPGGWFHRTAFTAAEWNNLAQTAFSPETSQTAARNVDSGRIAERETFG